MTNYEKLMDQLDNDALGFLLELNDLPGADNCILGILQKTGDNGVIERCKEYGDDFCALCIRDWLDEEEQE